MQYLFIDGAHLRIAYEQVVREFFGEAGEIDYVQLLRATSSQKGFLYDCIDDLRRDGETEAQLEERVGQQERAFQRIQALPYYHVKLGQLSGSRKKKRQKKVDILLAVDFQQFERSFIHGL